MLMKIICGKANTSASLADVVHFLNQYDEWHFTTLQLLTNCGYNQCKLNYTIRFIDAQQCDWTADAIVLLFGFVNLSSKFPYTKPWAIDYYKTQARDQ